MLEEYRNFAEQFAQAIVAKDFAIAQQMLAPWLQPFITPEALEQIIQTEVAETLAINEIKGDYFPRSYEIDGNSCTLDDLKELSSYREPRNIAPQITPENFRQWLVIQFQTSEEEGLEIDAYVDMWMIIVALDGSYKVGYFEMEDSD